MKTYREFRPTGFDPSGLGLPDRQDWILAPVSRTRDSGCLARSNWEVLTGELRSTFGAEGEDSGWEIHRFGHWGPGWFEIILLDPSRPELVAWAEDWARALADYPVASDNHYSELEWNETCEAWERASLRDRIEAIGRAGDCSIFAARRDELPESDLVRELFNPDRC